VNYIYGTWQVLRGPAALGYDMTEPWLLRARDWLESVQHADGGWGERCNTYDDPVFKGQGPSTASQTAWATMGLCAFDDPDRPSLRAASSTSSATQNEDGFLERGRNHRHGASRKVFYLKYDMYRNAWPLLALALCHLPQTPRKKPNSAAPPAPMSSKWNPPSSASFVASEAFLLPRSVSSPTPPTTRSRWTSIN
jgi:squalene cyclase